MPNSLLFPFGAPIIPVASGSVQKPMIDDAEDSANKAINYRTEPMWTRLRYHPGLSLFHINQLNFTNALSIAGTGPIETPIFEAQVGRRVRFRVVEPQGHQRNTGFHVQGHLWPREPRNRRSDFIGSQEGMGPSNHFNVNPIVPAGGPFAIRGDYLYRNRSSFLFDGGQWGVFRVSALSPGAE